MSLNPIIGSLRFSLSIIQGSVTPGNSKQSVKVRFRWTQTHVFLHIYLLMLCLDCFIDVNPWYIQDNLVEKCHKSYRMILYNNIHLKGMERVILTFLTLSRLVQFHLKFLREQLHYYSEWMVADSQFPLSQSSLLSYERAIKGYWLFFPHEHVLLRVFRSLRKRSVIDFVVRRCNSLCCFRYAIWTNVLGHMWFSRFGLLPLEGQS